MDLGLTGDVLVNIDIDYVVTLHFRSGAELGIEARSVVHNKDGEVVAEILPGMQGPWLSRVDVLRGKVVETSNVNESGELTVSFSDQVVLRVSPDPDHEAWNLVSVGRDRIVCLPGGEVAVWS